MANYEFVTPTTAKVQMSVPVTEGGYLAGSGDTPAGQKKFQIDGVKTAATNSECATVYNAFVTGIAGSTFDSTTTVKTVTYTVAEQEQEP